tara:strand:+ start:145 stop:819 length:675 start_codon:yes stop_codon:yes gene_type:complete
MDIHMQLLRKGVKAKKKRLAGGGGGGGASPNLVNTIVGAGTAKSGYNIPHSQARVEIREIFSNGSNNFVTLPNPSGGTTTWAAIDVEDYVATGIQGATNFNGGNFHQYDGEVTLIAGTNLPSGTDKYNIEFGAYLPNNSTLPITVTLTVLVDANNNLSTPPSVTNNFHFASLSIDTKHTGTPGFAIIKLTHNGAGFTTNADSDVIAGNSNAIATDTFYFKINFA